MKKKFLLLIIGFMPVFLVATENQQIETNIKRPKIGLVLAGGGAKGVAHLPVLKAIEELNIPIDFIAGTSMGAIIGGFYACGYSADEIYELVEGANWSTYFLDKPQDPMEGVLRENSSEANLLKIGLDNKLSLSLDSGFASGERIYQFFKEKTVKYPSTIHFDDLPIPFRAVATNLFTGEREILEKGDLAEAIRASMSIPGIFTPAQIDENYYIDGGISDNLPIQCAVDFGCDIIIAVDISEVLKTEISDFDSNYFVAVAQMFYITQEAKNKAKYPLADFVFVPDLGKYTLMSFKNTKEIWTLANKSLEPYLDELKKIKATLPKNEDVKKIENYIESYKGKKWLTISNIKVESDFLQDVKLIEEMFGGFREKPFTDKVYKDFVEDLYNSGNYKSVRTRINRVGDSYELEVTLEPTKASYGEILLSGTYSGVLSAKESTKLLFTADLQYRGLTGRNSVLSLKFGVINGFFVNGMFIQPISNKSFLKLNGRYYADRNFFTSNLQDLESEGTVSFGLIGSVGFGYRGNLNSFLYGGIDYVYIENRGFRSENLSSMVVSSEKLKDNGKNALSFNVNYSVNTLDLSDFPRSGFLFSVKNDFLLPLCKGNEKQFCNFIEGNFSAAIPLSKRFTLIGDVAAGTECLQNIVSMPNLFVSYGYNFGSRLFYPQFPNDYEYGTHGFQGMLTLQFSPWDNLTLLGGKIYFSYFVAGGNLWTSYEKMLSDFYDNMQWNTGLQIGVNIKKSFNIFLRGGIGTYGDRIVPFLSFDIGSLRM